MEGLKKYITELENSVEDKNNILQECVKMNLALQQDVINEIKELKSMYIVTVISQYLYLYIFSKAKDVRIARAYSK